MGTSTRTKKGRGGWGRGLLGIATLVVALSAGCSQSDTPPATQKPVAKNDSLFYFQFVTTNLSSPAATEHLALWYQVQGDSMWHGPLPFGWTVETGNGRIYKGDFVHTDSLRYLTRFLLSIEGQNASGPTAKLLAGDFTIADSSCALTPTDPLGVGDYSNLAASVTFTTALADTNRARHEFYLLEKHQDSVRSSVTGLPPIAPDWVYALWVVDPNYFPEHRFLYGLFRDPVGHDSKAKDDTYAFPGGYMPASLADPGAEIIWSLEPEFDTATLAARGPSQFVLMDAPLQRFIRYDESLPLTNEWAGRAPSARLSLSRNPF